MRVFNKPVKVNSLRDRSSESPLVETREEVLVDSRESLNWRVEGFWEKSTSRSQSHCFHCDSHNRERKRCFLLPGTFCLDGAVFVLSSRCIYITLMVKNFCQDSFISSYQSVLWVSALTCWRQRSADTFSEWHLVVRGVSASPGGLCNHHNWIFKRMWPLAAPVLIGGGTVSFDHYVTITSKLDPFIWEVNTDHCLEMENHVNYSHWAAGIKGNWIIFWHFPNRSI